MEQFNDTDRHEDDHDILFEDDPVPLEVPNYQARNVPDFVPVIPSVLTDAQVLLGYQVDADSSSIYNESDPISRMLKNLEKSVITEKDEEIRLLKSELDEKNKEIAQWNEKTVKLVDYITFVHGQFGNLLKGLMVMEIEGERNVLCLGPFKNENAKAEFIQSLNGLSTNFLSDYENLKKTRELFDKINLILNSRETVTNTQSATNSSTVHSSMEQLNGGVNYASSYTQPVPLPFPSNMTGAPPPPFSSCFTDMPPLISSTCNVPPPVNATEYTEYPVLSIREAPEPTSQSSTSYMMTMEPPPSPLNLTIRRPPPSISRNSLQADYGINLATANKKHGIGPSKGSWGFFCLCNTRFSSSDKLKDHIQYFTMKNFECVICKKRYHQPSLLKLHMISSHKIERFSNDTFTCSICHGNFKKTMEFWEHLKNIHDINIYFKNTFIDPNDIANSSVKHARDASVKPTHGCICGKIYANSSALSMHIKTKPPVKVFKCCWCTNKFQSHKGLKGHIRKVHGVEQDEQNKFGCTACGKTFPTFAEIRKHWADVHRKVNRQVLQN